MPCVPQKCSHHLLNISYLSGTKSCPTIVLYSSCSRLGIGYFPTGPWNLLVGTVIVNETPMTRFAYFYWRGTDSSSPQWRKKRGLSTLLHNQFPLTSAMSLPRGASQAHKQYKGRKRQVCSSSVLWFLMLHRRTKSAQFYSMCLAYIVFSCTFLKLIF